MSRSLLSTTRRGLPFPWTEREECKKIISLKYHYCLRVPDTPAASDLDVSLFYRWYSFFFQSLKVKVHPTFSSSATSMISRYDVSSCGVPRRRRRQLHDAHYWLRSLVSNPLLTQDKVFWRFVQFEELKNRFKLLIPLPCLCLYG